VAVTPSKTTKNEQDLSNANMMNKPLHSWATSSSKNNEYGNHVTCSFQTYVNIENVASSHASTTRDYSYSKRLDGLVGLHDCKMDVSCSPMERFTNNSATAWASLTHDDARLGFFPTATV
jgi:hypothetical protein